MKEQEEIFDWCHYLDRRTNFSDNVGVRLWCMSATARVWKERRRIRRKKKKKMETRTRMEKERERIKEKGKKEKEKGEIEK